MVTPVSNPVENVARAGLIVLATARLTRFVTSDWLGEWWFVGKARAWGERHDKRARRAEWTAMRDSTPGPVPAYAHWASPRDDEGPRTWQAKLVKGLDCPFCVGFWIGAGVLVLDSLVGRGPLRPLWALGLTAFSLNYLVGHISARIDS